MSSWSGALLRPESHGRFLDAAGRLMPLRDEVKRSYDAVRELDASLAEVRERAEERARRQDFLAFQLAEIDEVGLAPGELAQLAAEHTRLAHAGQLGSEGGAAVAALCGDAEQGLSPCAADRLGEAVRSLEEMCRLDAGLADPLERLRAAEAELRDVAADLERYVDGVEAEPARLGQLEDRIAQVEKLRRKYGQAESEILAFREQVAEELA